MTLMTIILKIICNKDISWFLTAVTYYTPEVPVDEMVHVVPRGIVIIRS